MHCASCAHNVERALKETAGVKEVNVNLASNNVSVVFDDKTNPQVLANAVDNTGFKLIVQNEGNAAADFQSNYYRNLKRKTFAAWILSVPIFLISMYGANLPLTNGLVALGAFVVLAYCGNSFYINAVRQLVNRKVSMDTLVAMSTFIDFVFSLSGLLMPSFWGKSGTHSPLFFDAAAMIVAFVLSGKLIEERAKQKTGSAIDSLTSLVPQTAILVMPDGSEKEIPAGNLKNGDKIRIRPGDSIAVDGIVESGATSVDESLMSGESVPVDKNSGCKVIAGTVNLNGSVVVKATGVGNDTFLAGIIKAVEEAQGSKAPAQRIADKVVSCFVPIVLAVSVVTFVAWMAIGGELYFTNAVMSAVSVLVIACPCSLGLATPTAITVGVGRGAKSHILFRDAGSLESLCKSDVVVFDKTGTLTEGKMSVVAENVCPACNDSDLRALYTAEQMSNHPLAKALYAYLHKHHGCTKPMTLSGFSNINGEGVTFEENGKRYWAGNDKLATRVGIDMQNPVSTGGLCGNDVFQSSSLVYFGDTDNILAVFAFKDKLREEAAEVVHKLKKNGKSIVLLSGDKETVTRQIAAETRINEAVWAATPDGKYNKIKELQEKGCKVAMIGDGTNDSEALAEADISVAMGKGTDVAINAAQIILMDNNLRSLPKAFNLSKETSRVIKRNLFWAFIYNIIGIPVAAGALFPAFNITLSPVFCSAAMAFSSVSVVLNSLTLYTKKI